MKCRLTFDLITYSNYDIDIEQTGEPQLTVSKDGEELRLVFYEGHYQTYQRMFKNNSATDQNGRRVYVTSLSRK